MREEHMRILTPGLFGLVVLFFFLPFANVSCRGKEIGSFSGFQLMTGSTLEVPPELANAQAAGLPKSLGNGSTTSQPPAALDPEQAEQMARMMATASVNQFSGSPVAIAAFLCALAGLGLALFSSGGKAGHFPAAAAGLGAVLLVILKFRVESQVSAGTMGMLEVRSAFGFWLAFLAFAVNAATNGWYARQGTGEPLEATRTPASFGAARPGNPVSKAYASFADVSRDVAEEPQPATAVPKVRGPIPLSEVEEPAGVFTQGASRPGPRGENDGDFPRR